MKNTQDLELRVEGEGHKPIQVAREEEGLRDILKIWQMTILELLTGQAT